MLIVLRSSTIRVTRDQGLWGSLLCALSSVNENSLCLSNKVLMVLWLLSCFFVLVCAHKTSMASIYIASSNIRHRHRHTHTCSHNSSRATKYMLLQEISAFNMHKDATRSLYPRVRNRFGMEQCTNGTYFSRIPPKMKRHTSNKWAGNKKI